MGMPLEDRETRVLVMGTPLLFSVHTIDEAVAARAWLLVSLPYKTDGNAPKWKTPGLWLVQEGSRCPCELECWAFGLSLVVFP